VSRLIRPYEPLAATECGLLADKLEEAIRHLVDQGVRVSASSRLPQAVKLLHAVAQRGAFPADAAELLPIANAIKAAFDFTAIRRALPDIPNAEVLDTCRRAVRGTLADEGPTPAHQAQSQLQFGCVLAETGLRTGAVHSRTRKAPDYLVSFLGLDAAIEVKRPGSRAGVQASVDDGVDQCCEFGEVSALALDLTDCVALPSSVFEGSSSELEAQATERFQEIHRHASDYIDRRKCEPGFDRCGVLWAFAGATFWPSEEPRRPLSRLLIYGESLNHARAGLLVDRTRQLRDRILEGFTDLGASDLQPRPVRPRLRFRGSRPT
jgi:hypothetical protein